MVEKVLLRLKTKTVARVKDYVHEGLAGAEHAHQQVDSLGIEASMIVNARGETRGLSGLIPAKVQYRGDSRNWKRVGVRICCLKLPSCQMVGRKEHDT